MAAGFARVAVLGTGLMGGSFALAVRKHFPETHLVGWDRPDVVQRAQELGAIGEGFAELGRAVAEAELVYLALPVGLALELLPEIARRASPNALVTDACSTKVAVCRLAKKCFPSGKLFLGGHPMAGKEASGMENADAELFRGAKYVLIGEASGSRTVDRRITSFFELVETLGAVPIWLDAETHDWAAAIVSHLPQLAAVALAEVVRDETDETGLPLALAGGGLRDALRLAGSPYPLWRDIALTNTENIDRALDRLIQALERIRMRLRTRELAEDFGAANEVYKILRGLQ